MNRGVIMKLHKLLRKHRGEEIKFRLDRWDKEAYFTTYGGIRPIMNGHGEMAILSPEEIMNKDWELYEK